MKTMLMGLLAETFLHPGSGDSAGVVDLPVAREKHTGYPVIFGSSLKGALRDKVESAKGKDEAKSIFGEQEKAGAVSVTDARIILLPVRSLTGHFRWVTCPYLLERYQRDCKLAGVETTYSSPREVGKGSAVSLKAEPASIFLEELSFSAQADEAKITEIAKELAHLIRHQRTKERLAKSLLILDDDDFKHFAENGLAVNARNVLADETKVSMNLWYEETVPPDAVFYSLLFCRQGQEAEGDKLAAIITERPYLQVGGNETVGQGWCAVTLSEEGEVLV